MSRDDVSTQDVSIQRVSIQDVSVQDVSGGHNETDPPQGEGSVGVVETGVDPVTPRFSGVCSAD